MIALPPIRLAMPADAGDIAAFSRDYIEQGLGWGYTSARVMRAIASTSTNVAVLCEADHLLAFGIMDYGDSSAHLALFGVQPAQRRRGLGAQMLAWLEVCAVTAGIERIVLEARADNAAAIAFYHSQGFETRTRVAGYYRSRIDALRLEKRLLTMPG